MGLLNRVLIDNVGAELWQVRHSYAAHGTPDESVRYSIASHSICHCHLDVSSTVLVHTARWTELLHTTILH